MENTIKEWQPIETAPTDGTDVILAIPGEKEPKIGYFDESRGYWRSNWPAEIQPTHWRPMFGMPDSDSPDADWQPIDTAPTDGTAVMLALPGADEWRDGWFENGVWRNQYVRKFEEAPTHWRPRLTMPAI